MQKQDLVVKLVLLVGLIVLLLIIVCAALGIHFH